MKDMRMKDMRVENAHATFHNISQHSGWHFAILDALSLQCTVVIEMNVVSQLEEQENWLTICLLLELLESNLFEVGNTCIGWLPF